ncbi:MAG: D-alanyl-D-alanine carboxypeptidase/D-alanyl-D-alanine-endopeptidase [Bacteroidaceae bacterium]
MKPCKRIGMNRLVWLLVWLWMLPVRLSAQADCRARLEALLQSSALQTSEVGLAVYDLTADRMVFAYQDRKLYRPASVLKLVTAVAALDRLGPDHPLSTSLYAGGRVTDGVLEGDLYVVGGFDSEFSDEGMEALVDCVRRAGIRQVTGRLYGDVSMKDSLYWEAGWAWDDASYYFQPCLSPLMYHKGYVEVEATPVEADSAARLVCRPASTFYTLRNCTRSRRPESGPFEAVRNWLEGGNEIVARGGVCGRRTDRVSMFPSSHFFLHVLRERLADAGITVGPYAVRPCPADSAFLLGTYAHTLRDALVPALKRSDNLSAEALFYQLAARGGRRHVGAADGLCELDSLLARLGFTPKDYRLADGCGVSLYNYVSPRLLLACLQYAYRHPALFAELYEALPQAGVDGSLRNRMKQGKAFRRVRAKTGSLTGVSSLAGYAHASDGHLLAFVIINQNILNASAAKDFQNKVCEALCR